MSLSNVIQIASVTPINARVLEAITLEDFCIADERAEWTKREVVDGHVFLHYQHCMICLTALGECVAYSAFNAPYLHLLEPLQDQLVAA